jgi:hypothetical protein
METHAHDLHKAPGHGFKHYFFEFFMLFLAVTLGFFVENQREHFTEQKKEIQYIRSYAEDLHSDIKQLDSLINYCNARNRIIDSLTYLLDSPDPDQHGNEIYYYARILTVNFSFFNNDRTIQQLKNGGNLRLIEKQPVSDAMMGYDWQIRTLDDIRGRDEYYVRDYVKWLEETCDARVFNKMITPAFGFIIPGGEPHLLRKDRSTVLEFISKIHFMKSSTTYLSVNFSKLKEAAQRTLNVIDKEYSHE